MSADDSQEASVSKLAQLHHAHHLLWSCMELVQWINKTVPERTFATQFHNPAIQKVAFAFAENVKRVERLLIMPFEIWHWAEQKQRAEQANEHFRKSIETVLREKWDSTVNQADFESEFDRFVAQTVSENARELGHFAYIPQPISPEGRHFWPHESADIGYDDMTVEGPLGFAAMALAREIFSRDFMQMALRSLVSSAVILAWSAIESFLADLWEAALNANPTEWAKLRGDIPDELVERKEAEHTAMVQLPGPNDQERNIKLSYLQKHNFDLSKKMGTVLKEKYNFTNFKSTRLAYLEAFDKCHQEIRKAVRHPSLTVLSEFRHVLVHKTGIADPKACKEIRKIKDRLDIVSRIQSDQLIPLDSETVNQIVRPAVEQAVTLIREIDLRISTYNGRQ